MIDRNIKTDMFRNRENNRLWWYVYHVFCRFLKPVTGLSTGLSDAFIGYKSIIKAWWSAWSDLGSSDCLLAALWIDIVFLSLLLFFFLLFFPTSYSQWWIHQQNELSPIFKFLSLLSISFRCNSYIAQAFIEAAWATFVISDWIENFEDQIKGLRWRLLTEHSLLFRRMSTVDYPFHALVWNLELRIIIESSGS